MDTGNKSEVAYVVKNEYGMYLLLDRRALPYRPTWTQYIHAADFFFNHAAAADTWSEKINLEEALKCTVKRVTITEEP